MQICSRANLAVLAVPKTGSTAMESALKAHADIVFTKARKHMTALRFHTVVAPFLDQALDLRPETLAVIRDPFDRARSWFRFRTRGTTDQPDHSTRDLSFDAFLADVIRKDPPPHAQIGNQHDFVSDAEGRILVDHLFAYERQQALRLFLSERLGAELVFKVKNVSPDVPAVASPEMEAAFRAARAGECALYDKVLAAGHLIR